MTKTFEDVRAALSKRASRITEAQMLYYANSRVLPDIQNDLYTTFERDFSKTFEIEIVAGQYEYDLPTDFFDLYSPVEKTSPITDESNNDLRKAYAGDYRSPSSSFGGRIYWISSDSIHFPKKSIDNSAIIPGEKIYMTYLKKVAEVTAEGSNLPFGGRLQDKMFPIYVSGIQYFFFTDGKKVVDRQLQLSNYRSDKANAFSLSI